MNLDPATAPTLDACEKPAEAIFLLTAAPTDVGEDSESRQAATPTGDAGEVPVAK